MGVFADWAEKYHELAINVLPIVENKAPPPGFKFKKWLTEKQTTEDIEWLVKTYGHCPGIAVVCGPVSGLCGFDYDYKYDQKKMKHLSEQKWREDNAYVEREIRNYLPDWNLSKMAKHGWTAFYKCDTEMKTQAADRNGVRLFDFKTTGYIVIPPSFHSFTEGKNIYYKWLEGDPMVDFSNLPEIDVGLVYDFQMKFGQKVRGKQLLSKHRHGRIYLHASAIGKIEQDVSKVAQSMINYDKKIHATDPQGPYFLDKKHCRGNPLEYAKKWAERIIDFTKDAPVDSTQDSYDYFFKEKVPYGKPKKDILTRKIFYRHPADNRWAMGEEIIPSLKSYGQAAGLAFSKIENEFLRFQEEVPDKDYLVDIPAHDGVDYLKNHVNALNSSVFSKEEMYEIFANWGYLLFARINDSNYQNRCIIIKGDQGIGKDDWIKAMVYDFKPYYQPLSVNTETSEMVSAVQKLFVAHLSEFDQTKKLDVAFLKDLITNSSSFMREKYGRVAIERPMRASWISSVNIDHMLRDSTGNRRFVVLPIETIDWSYKKPGIRIISQFKYFYESGLYQTVSKPTEDKIKTLIDGLTPEDMNQNIEEVFVSRLQDMISANRSNEMFVKSTQAVAMISDVARTFQVSINRVFAVARKYKKSNGKFRYYSL